MTSTSNRSHPIAIAGSGRVAQALGRLLQQRGEFVGFVASRTPDHAAQAAEFIGGGVQPVPYAELPQRSNRILIAVPDDALGRVIACLAATASIGGIALHTSGARDSEDFGPLQAAGYSCGTFHPLQTIADAAQGSAVLPGAAFAISGDDRAAEWARQLTHKLGGRALTIPPGKRALYHAAAVMASNYSVALLDAAAEMMGEATNTSPDTALRLLAPLIRTAVENTLERGPIAALTGPIERGDSTTVARHLAALALAPERIHNLYAAAGIQTLDLARRRGLTPEAASTLLRLLENSKSV